MEFAESFAHGLRFDAVAISYLLGPFFISLPFITGKRSVLAALFFFMVMLGAMNLLNCIDAEFFKFTARRSTDDLFEFAFLSDDLFNIAPNLLSHFWYLLAAFLGIMFLSLWLMNKVVVPNSAAIEWKSATVQTVLTIAMLMVGMRGGFVPIPIGIINASEIRNAQLNTIALNTPFTIIKTFGKPELREFDSFTEGQLIEVEPIVYPNSGSEHGLMKRSNVVVLIVESLSLEYMGFLNGLNVGYTPFLDSLCTQSYVFTNGYANGHRSIEGIAAVMASVPTLMYEPYSTSRYAENRISSFANLLNEDGYYSAFMHGGNKNSMNFESFCGQAEFKLFYDRDDYPKPDEHYDGYWGISDHYFLNHCVDKFSEFQQPFVTGIFTLSSHHPYSLPEEYKDRFPKGTLPIHESIGYTDESLRQFFENAQKTDWYKNTLFVITADHTSLSEHPYYQSRTGSLRIPIIMLHGGQPEFRGIDPRLMQQADILPSVLDLLGYEKPFFALGVSVFNETVPHGAFAFKHDQFQLLHNGMLTCMDGENPTFIFDTQKDPENRHNLVEQQPEMLEYDMAFLRTYIRNYSIALRENRMTYESWTQTQP